MPDLSTIPPSRTEAGTTFIELGTGDPAVIFVHGVGMNRNVWGPQLLDLSKNSRTIAYDVLGHGGSPLPPKGAKLDDYSAQLLRFLDDLGIDSAAIVGHSMGALIALEFALSNPDRVNALVALNAVYKRTPSQRAAVAARAKQMKSESVMAIQEQTINRWFDQTEIEKKAMLVENIRSWLANANIYGYSTTYEVFSTADRTLIDRLGSLQSKALYITGELDPNSTPEMSRQLAAESTHGSYVVIAGERHMMAYVSPKTVNPILAEFIKNPMDFDYDHESTAFTART